MFALIYAAVRLLWPAVRLTLFALVAVGWLVIALICLCTRQRAPRLSTRWLF
jgi:hypothetical protein